ncbi:hypothetical protein AVDCRST_MAG84-4356, partial [uncultured Microcoleus sp.]
KEIVEDESSAVENFFLEAEVAI